MIPILRMTALLAGAAVAYLLLRGWPDALPALVRGCLAVLALVAGIGLWARRPAADGPLARGRRLAGWLDYASVATAVLAVECAFLWLLLAAPEPLENAALAIERKFLPAAAARRSLADPGPDAATGNWLWTDQSRRPLPKRTNLKPGNRPEVFLRTTDPQDATELLEGRIYVRAFVLGLYEKAGWSAADPQRLVIRPDASGFIPLVPPAQRGGRLIGHEIFHSADAGGQNVLTALHGAVQAGLPELTRLGDGFHLLTPPPDAGGYQYTVASRPLRLEDLPRETAVAPAAGNPPELLEIPEAGDFGRRLKSMTLAAAGRGPLLDQLLKSRDHLRENFGYSLQTANSMDLDPMENFLFAERRGHCEYFATAGALMARALGVPSRVAYGWAGGTYHESGNWFVFRAREAHAWTEIQLDGLGWVVMDPTPPAAIGGERTRQALPDEPPPLALEPKTAAAAAAAAARGGDDGLLALWLLAAFALPAVLLMILRRAAARRTAPGAAASHDPAQAPNYLLAWHRARARRGLPAAIPGTPLRRQVRDTRPPPPFENDLWQYHYTTRYGQSPPDPEREKSLILRIRDWEIQKDPSPRNHS